jgi:hypothetical protein
MDSQKKNKEAPRLLLSKAVKAQKERMGGNREAAVKWLVDQLVHELRTGTRETLVVHKVEVGLLEKQRLTLHKVIDKKAMDDDERSLLVGLGNLLDYWSDQKYYAEEITEKDQ